MDPLPIVVLSVSEIDRARIIDALRTYYMECTEAQAEMLRHSLSPLPYDDDDLLDLLSQYVHVDWSKATMRREAVMRHLHQRYQTSENKEFVELQIINVTRGLDEHPEWWDLACHCNSCVQDSL